MVLCRMVWGSEVLFPFTELSWPEERIFFRGDHLVKDTCLLFDREISEALVSHSKSLKWSKSIWSGLTSQFDLVKMLIKLDDVKFLNHINLTVFSISSDFDFWFSKKDVYSHRNIWNLFFYLNLLCIRLIIDQAWSMAAELRIVTQLPPTTRCGCDLVLQLLCHRAKRDRQQAKRGLVFLNPDHLIASVNVFEKLVSLYERCLRQHQHWNGL